MKFHKKSVFRDEGGQDFEVQVFLVSDSIGAALNDADFVVRAFNKTEADFIVHFTVGNNAIPVAFDHGGELFEGSQSLPAQLRLPVVEKLSCPSGVSILPKAAKGFFEQVGFEQSLVGIEESPQRFAAFASEMIPFGEQRIALALDETTIFLAEAKVFLTANLVEGIIEMAQDMKFVVDDSDVRAKADHVGEWLPHIHHRQSDFGRFTRSQPVEEHFQILLSASLATEPDGAFTIQIADDDPINMPLANGDLIDADGARGRCSGPIHQLLKILFLQILNRLPVQSQQSSHTRDRLLPTHLAYLKSKTLGKVRIVRQPFQGLPFHLAADRAIHPTHPHLQVNAHLSAVQVPNLPQTSVVVTAPACATSTTNRFFARRSRWMTRACGSPHLPFSRPNGRKPGKRYNSSKVCPVFMHPRLNQKSRPVHRSAPPRENTDSCLKNHEIYPHKSGYIQFSFLLRRACPQLDWGSRCYRRPVAPSPLFPTPFAVRQPLLQGSRR